MYTLLLRHLDHLSDLLLLDDVEWNCLGQSFPRKNTQLVLPALESYPGTLDRSIHKDKAHEQSSLQEPRTLLIRSTEQILGFPFAICQYAKLPTHMRTPSLHASSLLLCIFPRTALLPYQWYFEGWLDHYHQIGLVHMVPINPFVSGALCHFEISRGVHISTLTAFVIISTSWIKVLLLPTIPETCFFGMLEGFSSW